MKKLYKLGAALLALCMAGTMGMTAFAADITSPGSGNATITAKASLPGQPTYTVTIPSTIQLGSITKTETSTVKSTAFEVKAANVADLGGKQIEVKISTADGTFHLASGANKLPYQVFNTATGGTAIASGGLFTSFTAAGTVAGRIDIDLKNIPAAGDYEGILTFTIALNNTSGGSLPGFTPGGSWGEPIS